MRSLILSSLVLGLLATLAPGQRLLLSAYGRTAESRLGQHAAMAGDVNRDGYLDLVVSAQGYSSKRVVPYVRVVSGRNGEVLHTFAASAASRVPARSAAVRAIATCIHRFCITSLLVMHGASARET